jgi:histidine triad (HIT) family protein
MDECLFCRIVAGEVPANIVFEDETVVAFSDIAPQAPLHVLVVPRRHIRNAAAVTPDDADVVAALVTSARAVADEAGLSGEDRGYRLVFNVGPDALNSVDHLHLHVLGGRTFDWPPG